MLSLEIVEDFYQYFYARKYKDLKFKFKRSKTTKSVCESFLAIINKKYSLHCVGPEFLWDYFLFQFNYWHELTMANSFTDTVTISYIVGKKAFERWNSRDREYDWQMETYPIIELYSIHKKDLFIKNEQLNKMNRVDSSKVVRRQFLNTNKGLAMCIEFTTLFDPTDMSCLRCKNRVTCKELLRANYPILSKKRGI